MKFGTLKNKDEFFYFQKLGGQKVTNAEIIKIETGIPENFSLVGGSPAFKGLLKEIEKAARYDVDVLLLGETGTGKENVARAIHLKSKRLEYPFVAVNSAALTPSLADSLLFGHAKGAFTGATAETKGFFEQAHGGRLFLDEIGDLPLELQAKLLRAIETRVLQPLGSTKEKVVDVRVISATNKDLRKEVKKGKFREDLYYRLKVISIDIPSLKDRKEDIPVLVKHFIKIFNKEHGMNIISMDKEAMLIIKNIFWEGNIRQLKNFILEMMISCSFDGRENISSDRLPKNLKNFLGTTENGCPICHENIMNIAEIKKIILLKALLCVGGNIDAAASILGVSTKACYNWAIEYFGSLDNARKEAGL